MVRPQQERKIFFFKMKQTFFLEFDTKDASDSECCRSWCCMAMGKQGNFCELCLIKAARLYKCESHFIFVTILGSYE